MGKRKSGFLKLVCLLAIQSFLCVNVYFGLPVQANVSMLANVSMQVNSFLSPALHLGNTAFKDVVAEKAGIKDAQKTYYDTIEVEIGDKFYVYGMNESGQKIILFESNPGKTIELFPSFDGQRGVFVVKSEDKFINDLYSVILGRKKAKLINSMVLSENVSKARVGQRRVFLQSGFIAKMYDLETGEAVDLGYDNLRGITKNFGNSGVFLSQLNNYDSFSPGPVPVVYKVNLDDQGEKAFEEVVTGEFLDGSNTMQENENLLAGVIEVNKRVDGSPIVKFCLVDKKTNEFFVTKDAFDWDQESRMEITNIEKLYAKIFFSLI